ncbi:MAG: hypothetical protein JKY95_15155 [Planctomycetaceae bacterium]|nr:hypothetical protein [Planctomycetaceae bacterium]
MYKVCSGLFSPQLVMFLICLFVLSGCKPTPPEDSSQHDSSRREQEQAETNHVSSNKPKELVGGWDKPKLAIVFTGEQRGYIEPCGCSETQSGGISRRADLFRQLREDKGWSVTGLELGGTLKRSRMQDRLKFGVLHAALTDMGYQAMGLGPSELKLQVDYLFSLVSNSVDPKTPLPFVSANVVFYNTPDLDTPARFRIIEIDGVKIGVTSVLGKKFSSQIFPQGNNSANELLKIEDPIKSLQPAVAELKKANCELLVLLSHCPRDETMSILNAVPEFDLCLTAGGPEDPSGVPETVGNTLVLEAGRKGKYAGVLGYYPDNAKQRFQYELVDLDKNRFSRIQAMEDHMSFYQDMLREQQIVESEPAVAHPSGNKYVGTEKCGLCHTKAFAQFKTTKHSHATRTLKQGAENYTETEWISRLHDPECLSCHVVGWNPQEVFRYESGYLNMNKTPHLVGQGCENCHGPGSHHVEMENVFKQTGKSTDDIVQARNSMKLDLVTAEKQVCQKCHDYENSPKFDFAKYWAKTIHRGKD